MFLKRGILDSMLDECGEGEDDEDAEEGVASDDSESIDVSDPVRDKMGCCSAPFISPKNLEANCTASECGMPAKATTVLSGR